MRTQWTVAALMAVAFASPSAQSLRERAKEQGGTARVSLSLWFTPVPVSELFATSDLVLHGRVANVSTQLSPDEAFVTTQYEVTPIQIMKQRATMTAARPGQRLAIVVERAGGVLNEGQYRYVTVVNAYPESEGFKVGEEVVLFLQHDVANRLFNFTDGPYGGFRITGSTVQPMTREAGAGRADPPADIDRFLLRLRQEAGK